MEETAEKVERKQ